MRSVMAGKHRKGSWNAHEDALLKRYIENSGILKRYTENSGIEVSWSKVPAEAGLLRSGKSCRFRWINYLRPNLKHSDITPEEQDLIIRLHKLLGNRWSLIARRLPGRTDNEIKNFWKCHTRKKNSNIVTDLRHQKRTEMGVQFYRHQADNSNVLYSEKKPGTMTKTSDGAEQFTCAMNNPPFPLQVDVDVDVDQEIYNLRSNLPDLSSREDPTTAVLSNSESSSFATNCVLRSSSHMQITPFTYDKEDQSSRVYKGINPWHCHMFSNQNPVNCHQMARLSEIKSLASNKHEHSTHNQYNRMSHLPFSDGAGSSAGLSDCSTMAQMDQKDHVTWQMVAAEHVATEYHCNDLYTVDAFLADVQWASCGHACSGVEDEEGFVWEKALW